MSWAQTDLLRVVDTDLTVLVVHLLNPYSASQQLFTLCLCNKGERIFKPSLTSFVVFTNHSMKPLLCNVVMFLLCRLEGSNEVLHYYFLICAEVNVKRDGGIYQTFQSE